MNQIDPSQFNTPGERAAYEKGRIEGRINNLEEWKIETTDVLKDHNNRLKILERIFYVLIALFALIKFLPELKDFLATLS